MNQKTKDQLEVYLNSVGDMALKRRARIIFHNLDPQDGEKILEVGCGDGFYLHVLSNVFPKVKLFGVDYDQNALNSAKKNLSKKITLGQADLMKSLPFPAKSFDKIIMSEVAEHLPDDVKGLKEVARVLKPGGTLLLSVPNHNYPLFWDPINRTLEFFFKTHIKSGFWAGLWNQHLRLYEPELIRSRVEKAGFKVEMVRSVTWWCLPFNHTLMYSAAKLLYGGSLTPDLAAAVSKFKVKARRPWYIAAAFGVVNGVDRLNDLWQPVNRGVGVFVKAVKA